MTAAAPNVLRLGAADETSVRDLLARLGLTLHVLDADCVIPGSFWGDCEAGLRGNGLYARPDTPLHSILHEASHYVCMSADRRPRLDTDAGGDYAEENGVCYLQILFANHLPGMGSERMIEDMDRWGYSFRLGCAKRWFREDSDDARDWLLGHGLIGPDREPTWRLRT